mmetsp:Transcript_11450/g.13575  ORF Transcript_11450/g.13575 Transcript_11450/m.13575 type:complete len:276 (-) Transcript_11450:538-1365(-)|eukprot:CAMPEP_0197853356 /NCGR_PEP_ID=MMETSP1438-20131217/22561_1 /TAXON_ID=1461541 /ORGANISM="Pterosperma sp., Strain CCMP1384" /LENGTH=275 /DNA_ID=CAMNT_0043467735 /DNA_START=255 /DNA_END=1082 /DNA_ORIENTATION=+
MSLQSTTVSTCRYTGRFQRNTFRRLPNGSGVPNHRRSYQAKQVVYAAASTDDSFLEQEFRPNVTRRRALFAAGETALDLGVAAAFELNFRPKAPGDEDMNIIQSIFSLLPAQKDPVKTEEAKDAVRLARKLAENGDDEGAIEEYAKAVELAPRDYLINQAVRSERHDIYQRLGNADGAGKDSLDQWCWGRGVRFPGHPILAYILLRRAFVGPTPGSERKLWNTSKEDRPSTSRESVPPPQQVGQAQQGGVSGIEIGIILATAALWNTLFYLTTYV